MLKVVFISWLSICPTTESSYWVSGSIIGSVIGSVGALEVNETPNPLSWDSWACPVGDEKLNCAPFVRSVGTGSYRRDGGGSGAVNLSRKLDGPFLGLLAASPLIPPDNGDIDTEVRSSDVQLVLSNVESGNSSMSVVVPFLTGELGAVWNSSSSSSEYLRLPGLEEKCCCRCWRSCNCCCSCCCRLVAMAGLGCLGPFRR